MTQYEESDFMWFEIDVTELHKVSKDQMIHLELIEYHKRRRQAFPESVALKDKQTMEYLDSRILLSPYPVLTQLTTYRLEAHRIISFTEAEGTKQVDDGIRYGPYKNMPPFSFEIIRLLFEYLDPLLILSEARKTVTVSQWGNILIDEYFALENVGSKLKGEYSRVDFEYYRRGDNCLKSISAVYPWYIQSMYFHDYIGNISSTNALREDDRVSLKY